MISKKSVVKPATPGAPSVAPFGGKLVTNDELVTPATPPLTFSIGAPNVYEIAPPAPDPPGPLASSKLAKLPYAIS